MAIDLPGIVSRYFAADQQGGADSVSACFTERAVVKDEGHTHSGRDAICKWKTESATKYRYTVEPVAISTDADRVTVTGHLVGDFPGSPVDLRYRFRLEGDRIAELEIAP
jgi:hypothetical protein